MSIIQKVADTIFDVPPTTGSLQGGRLMSSAPHNDGLLIYATGNIDVASSGATAFTKKRIAKGDWYIDVPSTGGIVTIDARVTLDDLLRTGETYINDLFGQDNKVAAPDKGIAILDIFAIYSISTLAATSATLRLGKTVYSKTVGGAAFAQTDLLVATAIAATTTPAANQYQYAVVPFQTQSSGTPLVFHKDDLGLIEIELEVVLTTTTVMRIAAIGAHCAHNRN
jgi:hypothetical protein